MTGPFSRLPLLFAQAAPDAGGGEGSMWILMVQFLPIVLLGYFLLIRPQQQQEKKRREMIGALKKNDYVLTAGGIYGTVVGLDTEGKTVTLRIDDNHNVRVTFSQPSITQVIDPSAEKEKSADAASK